MKRKSDKCSYHTNKKMNQKIYSLKRKVLNIIYEAKELLKGDMPRITIRITSCHKNNVLGTARMNDNIIWIPEETCSDQRLRHVVYHELCHAIWGVQHNNDCPLMNPIVSKPCTKKECQKIFLKYYNKNRKLTNLITHKPIDFSYEAWK